MDANSRKRSEKKHDEALQMTFPASDPPAHGTPTGTEPPRHPVDRRAPKTVREEGAGPGRSEERTALGGALPVGHPDRGKVKIRQKTGPRATVSALLISLAAAAIGGAIVVGHFIG